MHANGIWFDTCQCTEYLAFTAAAKPHKKTPLQLDRKTKDKKNMTSFDAKETTWVEGVENQMCFIDEKEYKYIYLLAVVLSS